MPAVKIGVELPILSQNRPLDRWDVRSSGQCNGGNQAMRQRIHRYAEAFQRSHTEKMHVARLGEDHVVIGDESFRLENAETDISIHGPAVSHSK
jgi:hypothetical protein